MTARFGASIALGAAVTFGLLWLMQLMISTGHGALTDKRAIPDVAFVRVERTLAPLVKEPPPERPPEQQPKPETPRSSDAGDFEGGIPVSFSAPTADRGVVVDGPGFTASDGEYLPVVMVQPIYPRRAQERGLEGYVIVEYTVTQAGTTRDVVVVESSHAWFEAPAVESARKYKYRPRVVNGEAVEVPGVRALIRFELEE